MLGHLHPNLRRIDEVNYTKYWNFYCSICATLRQQNNLTYGLLINNELTHILIAFAPYLSNIEAGKTACPARFFRVQKATFKHPAIQLAGDLSILLAWIKTLDWATDRPKMGKRLLVSLLNRKVKQFEQDLSTDLRSTLADYALLTRNNETDFELVKEQSGRLAAAMTQEITQYTTAPPDFIAYQVETFRQVGILINIADHLMDIELDIQQNNYNPILYAVEKDQISFYQAYHQVFQDFYLVQTTLLLRLHQQTDPQFATILQESIVRLGKKIQQNMPESIRASELDPILYMQAASCCANSSDGDYDGCSGDDEYGNSGCFYDEAGNFDIDGKYKTRKENRRQHRRDDYCCDY